MGILTRLLTGEKETRSNLETILSALGGTTTHSGVAVTPGGSLNNTAVLAAVRVLSESVASLPLMLYRRQGRGKERASNHPLYSLLHDAPNPYLTAFEFREMLQAHLLLWGNAYCSIESDGSGRVRALWPLRPDRMLDVQRLEGGSLAYHYQLPNGDTRWLTGDNVWHVRGLSHDGIQGYSPVHLARQAIGAAMATEEFGARFFKNGARPSFAVKHPGVLSDQAFDRLKADINAAYAGLSNAHRVLILEEGMDAVTVGLPPEDAQFLETRKFQVVDIARIFRVPPHMIGELERATFSNIEHQSIEFVTHSLRPWLVRWEQAASQQLLLEAERPTLFFEFLVDALLRGDTKSRYEAYAIGRQNGWLSANDVRDLENMNPVDGGDEYLSPLNMVPVGADARPDETEGQREARALPDRQERAIDTRRQLIAEFTPAVEDVLGRVVRREVADIKRQAKKAMGQRDLGDFLLWLEEFYRGHAAFIRRNLRPAMLAYAAAVARSVQNELGEAEPVTLENFITAYMEAYASRYTARQRTELVELIQRTQIDGGDVLQEINNRLDHWDEVIPEQDARAETHQANNALAIAAYGSYRVVRKVWRTLGDSCPYCSQLNGRVVAISEPFVPAGESLDGGEQGVLTVQKNVGHPPVHRGCDCMIAAA